MPPLSTILMAPSMIDTFIFCQNKTRIIKQGLLLIQYLTRASCTGARVGATHGCQLFGRTVACMRSYTRARGRSPHGDPAYACMSTGVFCLDPASCRPRPNPSYCVHTGNLEYFHHPVYFFELMFLVASSRALVYHFPDLEFTIT